MLSVCRGAELSRREEVGSDLGIWRRLHGQALELGLGVMGRISTSRSGGTNQGMQCAENGASRGSGWGWTWDPDNEHCILCFSHALEKGELQGSFLLLI